MKQVLVVFVLIVIVESQKITTNNGISRVNNSRSRYFTSSTSKPQPISETNEINDDPIPTNVWIPAGLTFSCKNRAPGYYADPSHLSKCQVYHMCMADGRKYSLLCGIGTIFNQITFVCDHWYNYHCADAESDYKRNDKLWNQYLTLTPNSDEEENDEIEYDDESPTMSSVLSP